MNHSLKSPCKLAEISLILSPLSEDKHTLPCSSLKIIAYCDTEAAKTVRMLILVTCISALQFLLYWSYSKKVKISTNIKYVELCNGTSYECSIFFSEILSLNVSSCCYLKSSELATCSFRDALTEEALWAQFLNIGPFICKMHFLSYLC